MAAGAGCLLTAGVGLVWLGQATEPVTLPGVTVIGPACRRDVYVREYLPGDGGPAGETWIYSLRAREPEPWRLADTRPLSRPCAGAGMGTVTLPRGRLLWAGAGFTVLLR